MMEFNEEKYSPISTTNELLSKVFFRMFLGLLATGLIAGYTYYSGMLDSILESNGFIILAIIEIVVVITFSLGFRKFSSNVVTGLFFIYSFITGVTFSTLFAIFELESIVYAFIGTAAIFGVLAYVGKNTSKDLTNLGTILSVTLIIGIIVSLINIFVGNTMIDVAMNWIMLFIFMGFTVYDMNKITNIQNEGVVDEEKLYVYGAMELYLDFINIFLKILYLFGNKRD